MIAYERVNRKAKRKVFIGIGLVILVGVGFMGYQHFTPKEEPVFREELVLNLPDTEKINEVIDTKVQFILPFEKGNVVVDYFDGETGEIISVIEFEGVYRPSQGVDISNNGESFNVYSASDGVVLDVMQDTMLGNGIRVQSGEYIITYQSLDNIKLKKGDVVKQKDVLGSSSSNIYQASLKNHLHLVVEKNGTRIDPNSIFKFK